MKFKIYIYIYKIIKQRTPTIKVRNKLHSKMLLPTIITTLHNNLREKQENEIVISVKGSIMTTTGHIEHIYRVQDMTAIQ